MQNLIAFINEWLSYFILFIGMGILVVAAVLLGIRTRIRKDEKDALTAAQEAQKGPEATKM